MKHVNNSLFSCAVLCPVTLPSLLKKKGVLFRCVAVLSPSCGLVRVPGGLLVAPWCSWQTLCPGCWCWLNLLTPSWSVGRLSRRCSWWGVWCSNLHWAGLLEKLSEWVLGPVGLLRRREQSSSGEEARRAKRREKRRERCRGRGGLYSPCSHLGVRSGGLWEAEFTALYLSSWGSQIQARLPTEMWPANPFFVLSHVEVPTVYIHIHICIYIYVYIYTHTHTHYT